MFNLSFNRIHNKIYKLASDSVKIYLNNDKANGVTESV